MQQTSLTIIRYPSWAVPFAFLSMAFFRLPLWLNKRIGFWKLMGCGKNGTFDIIPDLKQWAIMVNSDQPVPLSSSYSNMHVVLTSLYGSFIAGWIRMCRAESWTVILEPVEGHGTWDHKAVFGTLSPKSDFAGPVAVLTRATIRFSRQRYFWKHVAPVASKMASAKGFITSVGIGEIPWVKQATFSIWESKEDMKNFAYGMKEHQEVIRLTRQQKWYSEDMFVRFRIRLSLGSIHGKNPIPENLYL